MATHSATSQGGGADEKLVREGFKLSQPVAGISQTQAADGSQQNPPFITPEIIREDQVQAAVEFLSDPNVRGSPVIYRRSFLERKGLTKDEIDEAFNRVPDPPPNATAPDSGATILATQPNQQLQPQPLIQPPQPSVVVNLPPTSEEQEQPMNCCQFLFGMVMCFAYLAGVVIIIKIADSDFNKRVGNLHT